jgi:putative FmdB family regulatory protein
VPIYEYQCANCDYKLEAIQKVSDEPLLTCPKCSTNGLRKLVSAASFRLKGTGWYVTDFKHKPKKQDGGKESTTAGDDATKSADKTSTVPKDGGSDAKQEASGA